MIGLRSISRTLAGVGLAFAALAGVTAGPASAHPISGHWGTNDTYFTGADTLQAFSVGNNVVMWQSMLNVRYQAMGPAVTGGFNGMTVNHTRAWQTAHGLPADGVVGPATWGQARFWHVKYVQAHPYGQIYDYSDTHDSNGQTYHMPLLRGQVWLFMLGCEGRWTPTDHPTILQPINC